MRFAGVTGVDGRKLLGVVYTPAWLVRKILDEVGFDGRRGGLIDPACGEGAFLVEAAERILMACGDLSRVRGRLERELCGVDVDAAALAVCRERLGVLAARFGVEGVNWRLVCGDALEVAGEGGAAWRGRFAFVVGNPPYVRIQNLGEKRREAIQRRWRFCRQGSTDLYLAFFELGMELLAEGGGLGFITPNTWLKTRAARDLRVFLRREKVVRAVIDFGCHQLFDGIVTYSLIAVLQKGWRGAGFALVRGDGGGDFAAVGEVAFDELDDDNWVLCAPAQRRRLARLREGAAPLREIADIHVGITTLADRCYIFENPVWEGEAAWVRSPLGGVAAVEGALLRPIVKASVLKSAAEAQGRFVLFPYEWREGRCRIIGEEAMAGRFPLGYRYLRAVKPLLDRRDRGRPNAVAWYAFGRAQGLETSFGAKILTAPMNRHPNFVVWEAPEATFYAGYCVKYGGDLHGLAAVLNSEDMDFYIHAVSRCYRNNYRSFAKAFLGDFPVRFPVRRG